ncbi:MAG: hypothetical protein IPG64_17885 [Haliea sp.]|nr:hypothetical protein [Haliea sp.]
MVWEPELQLPRYRLPYAVGASIADDGKRPVLLTTSDSAFLYHIAELEVAHRFNLPIVTVVARACMWKKVKSWERPSRRRSPAASRQ